MEDENEKTIRRRAMRDKIRMAMADEKNGSKYAIYKRIQRTGNPFKTTDKRFKYDIDPATPRCEGLTRQTIHNRIKKMGWTIEQAVSTPLMRGKRRRHKKNGQDNGKTLSDSVLEK